MSGFTDSLVAGVGTLIRAFIRSANYVTGVSGWTINQDGSAEFNDVTVRGTVVGAEVIVKGSQGEILVYDNANPGAGDLQTMIVGSLGNDGLGNSWLGGSTQVRGTHTNPSPVVGLLSVPTQGIVGGGDAAVGLAASNTFDGTLNDVNQTKLSAKTSGGSFLEFAPASTPVMQTGVIANRTPDSELQLITTDGPTFSNFIWLTGKVKIASGIAAKYFHEEGRISVIQVIPNNVLTAVANAWSVFNVDSDYTQGFNAFSPGTVTVPVDGIYHIVFTPTLGSVVNTRWLAQLANLSTGLILSRIDIFATVTSPVYKNTISWMGFLAAGTTVQPAVLQASGVNQNLSDGYMQIVRIP